MLPVKIAVLISGGGTNLQALIDSIDNEYVNAEIAVVISNRKDAYGLKRAQIKGIENIYLNKNLHRKNHFAQNTIAYINEQLDEISDSLAVAENRLEKFRCLLR